MTTLPAWAAAIVVEQDIDQDAHAVAVHSSRTVFDSARRAVHYAERSTADHVVVSDPQGNAIWPEEACL
jgi:hypothetical protein